MASDSFYSPVSSGLMTAVGNYEWYYPTSYRVEILAETSELSNWTAAFLGPRRFCVWDQPQNVSYTLPNYHAVAVYRHNDTPAPDSSSDTVLLLLRSDDVAAAKYHFQLVAIDGNDANLSQCACASNTKHFCCQRFTEIAGEMRIHSADQADMTLLLPDIVDEIETHHSEQMLQLNQIHQTSRACHVCNQSETTIGSGSEARIAFLYASAAAAFLFFTFVLIAMSWRRRCRRQIAKIKVMQGKENVLAQWMVHWMESERQHEDTLQERQDTLQASTPGAQHPGRNGWDRESFTACLQNTQVAQDVLTDNLVEIMVTEEGETLEMG